MNINQRAPVYSIVTTYILQQRSILEIITINNTNYQCFGLFQGQGQGYFNCSITIINVHTITTIGAK